MIIQPFHALVLHLVLLPQLKRLPSFALDSMLGISEILCVPKRLAGRGVGRKVGLWLTLPATAKRGRTKAVSAAPVATPPVTPNAGVLEQPVAAHASSPAV